MALARRLWSRALGPSDLLAPMVRASVHVYFNADWQMTVSWSIGAYTPEEATKIAQGMLAATHSVARELGLELKVRPTEEPPR